MKSRLLFITALLVITIGGAKAQTYTLDISQGHTLDAYDQAALIVLQYINEITTTTSSGTTTVKNSSGTTLFTYNSIKTCSLPYTTTSANSVTRQHNLSINTLISIGATYMGSYSHIYLKFPNPVAYAAYNSSTSTLSFRCDHERGNYNPTYDLNTNVNNPGWLGKNPGTVWFDISFANARPTSCYKWFYDMNSLVRINFNGYLNTTNVTNMDYMFYGCSNLNQLSVSSLSTANVTSMKAMFFNCSKLSSLDLSNFNTAKVTDMSSMFSGCSGLTSLTLSSFNTAKVTDMSSMFSGCSGLTSLSVSSFNTAKVTNMSSMFYGCSKLTSLNLNLTNFTITSSTNTSSMLGNMGKLGKLSLGSSMVTYLNSNACLGIGSATAPCTLKYPTTSHPSFTVTADYVLFKSGYFKSANMEAYAYLSGNTLTFYYDDYSASRGSYNVFSLNTLANNPSWLGYYNTVTKVVFDSSFANARPTNCYKWFDGMNKITSITGLQYLNTSRVTYMYGMFNGCSSLTTLNLSSFDTANVSNMDYMFSDCSSLTSLNLSSFNTANVESMYCMFYGCSGLTSLNLSSFNTANVESMYSMFSGCSSLTSLNLSSFNTANVTNMANMFKNCSGLTSLNLSNFNTAKVTNMANMFKNCSGLTSLNLSNFNTGKVTNMSSMFSGCSGFTSLDLSSFNTANVTDMSSMFNGCSGLTSLDLDNFNSANVTDLGDMFKDCSGLTSLYLMSGLEGFSSSTNTLGMLWNLTSLQTLSISKSLVDYLCDENACMRIGSPTMPCTLQYPTTVHPTFTEVTPDYVKWYGGYFKSANMVPYAFKDDDLLVFYYDDYRFSRFLSEDQEIYNLPDDVFDPEWQEAGNVESICRVAFDSSFANARPTICRSWFAHMDVEFLDIEYFNTSNVTDMSYMFSDGNFDYGLDLSHFNTSNVTDMSHMFDGCSYNQNSLDLSSFNTSNVTNMANMFQHNNVETIYVGDEWSTAAVGTSNDMFLGCNNLVGGNGTQYSSSHVDAAYAHVDGMGGPGYFTSKTGFLPGDVNKDGYVTIADITALVDILLGNDPEGTRYNHAAADVCEPYNSLTNDDVNALVNMILNP